MAPVEESRNEVLDRVFNALWRENFARDRRWGRVCGCDGGMFAIVTLVDGTEVMGRLAAAHPLDRVSTSFPYYARFPSSGLIEAIASVEQMTDLLPASAHTLSRLGREVDQSAGNMALFLARQGGRIKELPAPSGRRGMLERVFSKTQVRGCRPEEYLESWVLRGHALHPGTKTRAGFMTPDLERYSPELGRHIGVRFVALKKTHLIDSRSTTEHWAYPADWRRAFAASARAKSLSLKEYEVLPVHPWQWTNRIEPLFQRELEQGVLVPLDAVVSGQPLASLRTIAPVDATRSPQLKLPLAIQATSVLRTITAPTVENSPRITDLLNKILERTPELARLVSLSPETRGVHFWEPGAPVSDAASLEKARHLTMLLRRRPARRAGEWLVPNAILTERSPLGGRPFVDELVEKSGGDALLYFSDYVSLSARVCLTFLAQFGLGIEAHAQNTLTYHRRGTPAGWMIRDFGGMRINRRRLAQAGFNIRLHPETLIETKDDAELVSSFHHSWLQGNVAPLASSLAGSFGVPEPVLWRAAREAVRIAWEEASARVEKRRADELERLLFRPRVAVKALTRMRLSDDPWRDEFCEVDNPLAEPAR